jgi:Concanavalin A-like lectin/glucanases superfamily/Secretion system C-terminal sorting domain
MRSSLPCLVVALCCPTCFCSGQNIDSSLVLFYPFDGDALDNSGNQIDGTLTGPTFTEDRFGNANRALHFNGTGDFLTADPSEMLDTLVAPLTVSSWVRIDGWWDGLWAAIMSKSVTALSSLQYRVILKNDGTYWLAPYVGCQQFQGSDDPPLNTWFYMTVAYDTQSVSFFVNGELTNTFACTTPMVPNTYPLVLGKDPHGTTEYLNGALDDFRIYSRALSGVEVEMLYGTTTTTPELAPLHPFTVYPNPTTDVLTIRNPDLLPILWVELSELSGRRVRSWSGGVAHTELGIGSISRGTYLLTVKTAQQSYTQRIVLD